MSDILTRAANMEDLDTLLAFEQAIIEYERPMVRDMQQEKFHYYDLAEMIQSNNAQVVVAMSDRRIIGSGYAKIKRSKEYLTHEYHAFLGFMYVEPDFRGQGVNQKIIASLIDWSRAKGLSVCALTVFDQNESAIRAYEKIGFKKEVIEMELHL